MKKIIITIYMFFLFSSPLFPTEILDNLIKKANSGDGMAQLKLGVMYQYGKDVLKNYRKALEYYENAANKGYKEA